MKVYKTCIDIIGVERCTGCFACGPMCHSRSIGFELDAEGFYKPVISRDTCDDCGVCVVKCPVIASDKNRLPISPWPEPRFFAAWTRNEALRVASSSGGIFSELAGQVVAANGAVVGCIMGEDWIPRHVLTNDWVQIEKMRGSKYVPSNLGVVYQQVLERLRSASGPILFSGLPCQIAGLGLILKKQQRDRVLLVEVICHGVPSLRVFHKYLSELFKGEPVASYTFRDKAFGWLTVLAESTGGKRHHMPAPQDLFMAGYSSHHLYVQEACHKCEFARIPRSADITLGDFWGCPQKWYDKRGVSLLLANTPAGLQALENLRDANKIDLEATDLKTATCASKRLVKGGYPINGNRKNFLAGIKEGESFARLTVRYFPSKTRILWERFGQSDAKIMFIIHFVLARVRRLFSLKENRFFNKPNKIQR